MKSFYLLHCTEEKTDLENSERQFAQGHTQPAETGTWACCPYPSIPLPPCPTWDKYTKWNTSQIPMQFLYLSLSPVQVQNERKKCFPSANNTTNIATLTLFSK